MVRAATCSAPRAHAPHRVPRPDRRRYTSGYAPSGAGLPDGSIENSAPFRPVVRPLRHLVDATASPWPAKPMLLRQPPGGARRLTGGADTGIARGQLM